MGRPVQPVDEELAELTRDLHPRLVGMLVLYLGDRQIAEDLAQETLIRLHLKWDSVKGHASPTAWASRVALNLASSWWRRRGAEDRANAKSSAGSPAVAVDADAAEAVAIREAVSALPKRQRAAIVLRFYQGLSVRETATAMRCAPGTVKSLTAHAMAALREQFIDLDATPIDRPDDVLRPAQSSDPEPTSKETFHA